MYHDRLKHIKLNKNQAAWVNKTRELIKFMFQERGFKSSQRNTEDKKDNENKHDKNLWNSTSKWSRW